MKKIIAILFSLLFLSSSSYAYVSSFDVEIEKDIASPNETLDMTIKAVDDDWDVVEDYEWDVMMLIWWDNFDADVEFPSDGFYEFKAEDQWEVTFTKWLIFRDTWDFEVEVEDLMDADVSWSTNITIDSWADWMEFDVNVDSPVDWSTHTSHSINVIGSTDAPNTIYEIFINDEMVRDDITDENWDFNTYVDGQWAGELTLRVDLVGIDWNVVWQSDDINFTHEPDEEELFKSIELSPWNDVKQWDSVDITVETSSSAEAVDLNIEGYDVFTMDRTSEWVFERTITMNDSWSYELSVEVMAMWDWENFRNVDHINVEKERSIRNIRFERLPESDAIDFEWSFDWEIPKFKFAYATSEEDLDSSDRYEAVVDENEYTLENVEEWDNYYVRVYPLDIYDEVYWNESDIVLVEAWMMASPSCTVSWITLWTKTEDWTNYLTWDEVEWADIYEIYMAEDETSSISDMSKVWETDDTKFEYPFDADSEEEIYKWYAVQAKCSDWESVKLDGIEKVKVWPMMNIILFLMLALFVYFWIYLLRTSRN